MKIKNLILIVLILAAASSIGLAQKKKTKEIAPDQVVKNLYAAQKTEATNPFIQTKNSARFFVWKNGLLLASCAAYKFFTTASGVPAAAAAFFFV